MLPYEIILSVMGIIIFLALIFLMVWMVMKKRSITILLPFFLISIVMVAFPTLSSVKVGDFIIEIREQAKLVRNNPNDTEAVQNLLNSLNQIDSNKKLLNNSDALIAAAEAKIVLGDYESASEYLEKGKELNPESAEISSTQDLLNEKIASKKQFQKNINSLNIAIEQLKETPSDSRAIRSVEEILTEMKAPDYVSADEVLTIARSYAIVGQQKQSLQAIDIIKPSSEQENNNINNLKDSIENNNFHRQIPENLREIQAEEAVHPDRSNLLKKSVVRRFN